MLKDRLNNNIIKGLLFAGIFLCILLAASFLIKPPFGPIYNIVQVDQDIDSFEEETPDSIDVVFAGNSEVYRTFSPLQLFLENGISSYCMSGSALRLCDATALVKKAFDTQSPKVVVLEADAIFSEADPHKDASALPTNFIEDLLPIFHYHIFYKALEPDLSKEQGLKGFVKTDAAVPYEGPEDYMSVGEQVRINSISLKYLDELREFCEKKQVPLVIAAAPNAKNWTYSKSDSLKEYAEKYGLHFIDLNLHLEDMGIDWKTDTMDAGNHVSFSGSKKTTRFIGDYLKNNFSLPDRRGEPGYEEWPKVNEELEIYP